MSETITFTLDGEEVEAAPGETIWEIAKRRGNTIPHLCHRDTPGDRPDANCRACMVEIEGERYLPRLAPRLDGRVERALQADLTSLSELHPVAGGADQWLPEQSIAEGIGDGFDIVLKSLKSCKGIPFYELKTRLHI